MNSFELSSFIWSVADLLRGDCRPGREMAEERCE